MSKGLNSGSEDVFLGEGDILAGLEACSTEDRFEYRQQVDRWCRQLAEKGLGRLGLPREDGGDPEKLLSVVRCLLRFDRSLFVKFGIHVGLIQGTIARLGSSRHRAWLESTWNFEQLGCFAMTETDHGSHVRGLETTATFDRESQEFEIHTPHRGARKDYIGGALSARFAIVFAQLQEHGVHAFLVPLRDGKGRLLAGISVEDCGRKLGLNGVDNGRLAFERVRVPRENLLNRFGDVAPDGTYSSPVTHPTKRFFTMLSNLVDGRLSLSAASLDISASALEIALNYASQRRQFGAVGQPERRLLDYQAHQVRLLPRVALTLALEGGVARFVELHRGAHPELETFAAGLKAYSTWSLQETLRLCRDCCGGWGYLWDNQLASMKADCDIFTTFEGDNTVLCFLVARNLLGQLRGCGNLLRGLPWPRRLTGDPADFPQLLRALRWRQQRLTFSLGRRLRHRMKGGSEPLEAFAECQMHALHLSRAYVECQLMETFQIQDRWGVFYGLHCLYEDRAWFLESGYLSRNQSRLLRKRLLEFSAQLREPALQQALRLVAGSGTGLSENRDADV